MESGPLPIEDLQSGEFYDIQILDKSPVLMGALLLENLPNNQAKLMLSSSNFDRFNGPLDRGLVFGWRDLQVTTERLYSVYPYRSFTHLSNKILKWPENYEGEELIDQIKKEMRKAVSEGSCVFNLPHFCEGYLPLYLSYLHWSANCPNRSELFDLLLEFMDSFFSVLRKHILRVKLLPEEHLRELLKTMKDMDQIPEMVLEISKERASRQYIEKSLEIAERKKSYFDSYRPIELSSERFDRLWELIAQEYHQDLIIWQLQEPLSLWNLLLHPSKLIGILSCYPEYARDLMDLNFPDLQYEEILRLKPTIEATANTFRLAEDLVEQSVIAELSHIILENELVRPILISRSEKLKDFVLAQAELLPSVLAYLNSTSRENIQINKFLKCATARIALEDWQFITFLIEHRTLKPVTRICNIEETSNQIKELVLTSVEHQMSAGLLRDLLPCVDYGQLVFSALAERFCLPHSREMMITYFGLNELTTVSNSSQTKDIFSFLNCLTIRIALEDWQFINLLIESDILCHTTWYSLRDTQELYEKMRELVDIAMDHKMSAEILSTLLPCGYFGHLVFPSLVEKFHIPHYRQSMITYFRPQQRSYQINLIYLKFLMSKIAVEDWEFHPIALNELATKHSFIHRKDQINELVRLSLEHNMSPELLRDLLPYMDYGELVYSALATQSHLPHCREMMITYFNADQWQTDIDISYVKARLLIFFRIFTEQIRNKSKFETFVSNSIRIPAANDSVLDDQEVYEALRSLVCHYLEQDLPVEVLKDLLPCVDYGHFVFPILVNSWDRPKFRKFVINYFKPEIWRSDNNPVNSKERLLSLWMRLLLQMLKDPKYFSSLQNPKWNKSFQEIVDVTLEFNLCAQLLRRVFPCRSYGHLVFPALVESFSLPKCRDIMIKYFSPEEWHRDFKNPNGKDRLSSFFDCLVTRITFGDQDFVGFITNNPIIVPSMQSDSLKSEVRNHIKRLINLLSTRQINLDLIRSVFPGVDYGHLVFPALAERFSLPQCRQIVSNYFRLEEWHRNFNILKADARLLRLSEGLAARIAIEDWEFVTFLINSSIIPSIYQVSFSIPQLYQNLEPIFYSAVEHTMNVDLLQQLFNCRNYGDLAFPAFLKASFGSRCREMMISYYGSERRCISIALEMLSLTSENQEIHKMGCPRLRKNRPYIIKRSKYLDQYLKGEKRNLWYVFGAVMRLQFIWIRQYGIGFIKRLSLGLTQEICEYLA